MLAFNQQSKWDGFKSRFPAWKCQKSCSDASHSGDVLCSDYWIIGIHQWFVPILGCVSTHRTEGAKITWDVLLKLGPSSLRRCKWGCLLLSMDCQKKKNCMGHYYSFAVSLIEHHIINQASYVSYTTNSGSLMSPISAWGPVMTNLNSPSRIWCQRLQRGGESYGRWSDYLCVYKLPLKNYDGA